MKYGPSCAIPCGYQPRVNRGLGTWDTGLAYPVCIALPLPTSASAPARDSSSPPPARAAIGFWGLVALTFFTVSGGAYGLEPVIGGVGAVAGLALILLTPVFWSLPTALAVGEMSAMYPLRGGYFHWVRIALGDFWGFLEGWWSWMFTFVDMALYPVLCGDILAQIWPLLTGHVLAPAARIGFILGFIWLAALINAAGARWVASYSLFAMALVLAPFVAFILAAWLRAHPHAGAGFAPVKIVQGGWGLALAAVLWNYTGWDNVATFAPQVRCPGRTYPRALLATLALIVVAYVVPVLAGLHLNPVTADWSDGYFVRLGALAWGPWLSLTMAITAVLSAWAQYTSQVLYVMQLPVELAAAGFLPQILARTDAREVPWRALWLSTVLYSLFALASFGRLLVADLLLYFAGLSLEFLALLALRRNLPHAPRPFRAARTWPGLVLLCLSPLLMGGISVYFSARHSPAFAAIGVALLGTGPVWYFLARRRAKFIPA